MKFKNFYDKLANYFFAVSVFLLLLVSFQNHAQAGAVITGTVVDDGGLGIPGVNINEKGTANYATTDLDGNFSITIAGAASELTFSYLGFEPVTQPVGDKRKLSIILRPSVSELDEVVVIGYGTARKSDLTGAVSTISGQELQKQGIANVAEALTGRLAGVNVTSAEGSPDSEIKIRVRGNGSISQDSSPLLIVDGFPVNSINDISPSDIDTVTVLKDASSTAIYGSRGANGVIIITTKSGTTDSKLSVNLTSFYGVKHRVKKIDVLGVQDYANWQYEYAQLNEVPESYDEVFGPWSPNQYAGVEGRNWQDEIYGQTGWVQSHDLGLRGGSDKMNYSFNYARFDEQAIMLGSDYRRNNLSLNLKNKPSDKVTLNFVMRYSDTEINGAGANEQNEYSSQDSRLRNSVAYAPINLPGITSDDTDEADPSYLVNPFVSVYDNGRSQMRKNFNMLGSFSWEIIDNLKFKTDFGLDNYNYRDNRFFGRSTYYVRNIPATENQNLPALIMGDRKDVRFRNVNTLNYDFKKILGENHDLTILVGEESINYKSTTTTSTIHGFDEFYTFENAVNLSAAGTPFSVDNFMFPEDKLLSFFGRINYDFDDRYLLTATYRADGSSKFLGDNRWGYFPSAAVAWKISSEEFLQGISWLNLLKVRFSYGQAGNNNIPTGQTIQTFQASASSWINGVSNFLSASKIMANPNLKWETTTTRNLGLDYEFFKGRISGSVELYKNTTDDLLLRFPVPGTGYDFQYRNMGEIENKGIEANVNAIIADQKNYGLSVALNIASNRNRINSLGVMDNFDFASAWNSTVGTDYRIEVGQPLGVMYGYQSDGRYEVSDFTFANGVYTLREGVANSTAVVGDVMPGTMKLKDTNGDGVVNQDDRTIIGNANPKYTGGFTINANAYGFDLSAAFNFSYGNDVYNASKIEFNTSLPPGGQSGQYKNLTTEMAQGVRWTNIDPSTGTLVTDPAQLSALNANTTMWSPSMDRFVFSDWAVEDGSFLRLNTLTLGYSLPESVISKLGLTRLRVYGTANNVFVWTNYSGMDPEVSTRRQTPLTPAVDYSPYPRSRQFAFGLNVGF
ncbi:TonB-dependent receptor [Flavobacterium sp. J372]|uniref:SusC/RagA family TonB-linked outer membrane protein n=1 Tax=Flavobacterium sp. J372 TaxID=2898436 RepID=UPI002151CD4C|nr:TonB-dependent receptor [Flavobacterium sp. J372]MCR5862078.1 TonB-dependent receptor [Flavobacterium sp. J372]